MRFFISSDWHRDAYTAGVPRARELDEYVGRLCDAAAAEKPDRILFAGDYADPGGMLQSWHASASVLLFRSLARVAPVVAIAGNHDVVEVDYCLTTLSPLRAAVRAAGDVTVVEKPTLLEVGSLALLCLPYASRAFAASDTYKAALGVAVETAKRCDAVVPLAHLSVGGAAMGSESVELSRGRELPFPDELVDTMNVVVAVNGHYHVPQVVDRGRWQIVIPGSGLALTFGDGSARRKGYVVLDL